MWNSQGEFADVFLTNHGSVIIGLCQTKEYITPFSFFFFLKKKKKKKKKKRKKRKEKERKKKKKKKKEKKKEYINGF